MTNGDRFDVVGFDADDTLWRSEEFFRDAEALFVELVSPYAHEGIDVLAALRATEVANVAITGYGVKGHALSMVQAAVTVTGGRVPATVIGQLVDHAHEMMMHPVELMPGIPETLTAVGATHRLVMITKGDLVHQTRKVRTSGIEHHFEHIEVVLEKDIDSYRRVIERLDVQPERFVMIGNSVRSDVLPVIELGGTGIHVPYHLTWEHEMVHDHDGGFVELGAVTELPAWLAAAAG